MTKMWSRGEEKGCHVQFAFRSLAYLVLKVQRSIGRVLSLARSRSLFLKRKLALQICVRYHEKNLGSKKTRSAHSHEKRCPDPTACRWNLPSPPLSPPYPRLVWKLRITRHCASPLTSARSSSLFIEDSLFERKKNQKRSILRRTA